MVERTRFPVGFAVALEGESSEGVEEISDRFSTFLPYVALQPFPQRGSGRLSWYITEVGPVRWRPGLFIAVGESPTGFFPFDLNADASSIRASGIVEAMSARLMARLN